MNIIFSDKYFRFVLIFICSFLFIAVKNDPFFGDSISSTSRLANHIYDNHLLTIFYPVNADPAHPTLYSWILAGIWKIFGRTLYVAHLYSIMWMLALAS